MDESSIIYSSNDEDVLRVDYSGDRMSEKDENNFLSETLSSELPVFLKPTVLKSTKASIPRVHICGICQKSFKTAAILKFHIRIHTGERQFVCKYPGCNKSFVQQGQLNSHMILHSQEKPFKCPVEGCETQYAKFGTHKCQKHPNERLKRVKTTILNPVFHENPPSDEVIAWFQWYKQKREINELVIKVNKDKKVTQIKTNNDENKVTNQEKVICNKTAGKKSRKQENKTSNKKMKHTSQENKKQPVNEIIMSTPHNIANHFQERVTESEAISYPDKLELEKKQYNKPDLKTSYLLGKNHILNVPHMPVLITTHPDEDKPESKPTNLERNQSLSVSFMSEFITIHGDENNKPKSQPINIERNQTLSDPFMSEFITIHTDDNNKPKLQSANIERNHTLPCMHEFIILHADENNNRSKSQSTNLERNEALSKSFMSEFITHADEDSNKLKPQSTNTERNHTLDVPYLSELITLHADNNKNITMRKSVKIQKQPSTYSPVYSSQLTYIPNIMKLLKRIEINRKKPDKIIYKPTVKHIIAPVNKVNDMKKNHNVSKNTTLINQISIPNNNEKNSTQNASVIQSDLCLATSTTEGNNTDRNVHISMNPTELNQLPNNNGDDDGNNNKPVTLETRHHLCIESIEILSARYKSCCFTNQAKQELGNEQKNQKIVPYLV